MTESRHLLSPEALSADPSIVVFDCRFSLADADAGRRAYDAGHIPGARFADLEQDLSGPPGRGGRHPLPDRDALAESLRAWGVDDDTMIACYDDSSGAVAGRFWWLVRWLGHERVALLDGGLAAWIAAGFGTDADRVEPAPGNFTAREALTRCCSAEDLEHGAGQLLDARESVRFRGESEPIDTVAGHIPGAVCAPFAENLADGKLKSPDALRARFRALDVDAGSDIVCYCGSGVTAAHNILALLVAGFAEPALYPGSWSGWITDPERPVATGAGPP